MASFNPFDPFADEAFEPGTVSFARVAGGQIRCHEIGKLAEVAALRGLKRFGHESAALMDLSIRGAHDPLGKECSGACLRDIRSCDDHVTGSLCADGIAGST